MAAGGIPGRLRRAARGREDLTALVGNKACRHESLTYSRLWSLVDSFAAGLLELGCDTGDHIGLVAENSDLWLIADLAVLSLGAVDVPRGGDASAAEVEFCVSHAKCRAAIVESAAHVEKLGAARAALDWVVVLRGDAPEGALTFDQVVERGATRLQANPTEIADRAASVDPTALATIIYTSGTTGNPKGVMLTHTNIAHNIVSLPEVVDFKPQGRFLSFLPSWHSFERAVEYIVLDQGLELHYSSKWTLKDDFGRIRPDFVCGVPRVWETFYNSLIGALEKKGGAARKLVGGALAGSKTHTEARRRLRGWKIVDGKIQRPNAIEKLGCLATAAVTWAPHALADKLIYSKLRAALGGRVNAAVSGGGPLPAHVDEFMTRAGVPLLNGYGLTESSPVICVRTARRNILGTIGKPVLMTEVRIVGDDGNDVGLCKRGVIQARGPQVMRGYFENESATRAALPGDGWLDTGDVGMLSSEGDVMITGRAKDTIVLRGGENVEPEPIETELCSSPSIAEALVIGHGQKTLGVLVVPDPSAVATAIGLPGRPDLSDIASNDEAIAHLKAEVGRLINGQRGYRHFERIGRVHVLDTPFSIDDGTLTATMKKRRQVIESKYADLITSLFGESIPNPQQ